MDIPIETQTNFKNKNGLSPLKLSRNSGLNGNNINNIDLDLAHNNNIPNLLLNNQDMETSKILSPPHKRNRSSYSPKKQKKSASSSKNSPHKPQTLDTLQFGNSEVLPQTQKEKDSFKKKIMKYLPIKKLNKSTY